MAGAVRKGKTGVSTSGIEMSPAKRKRQALRRRAEVEGWEARSGPVTVTRVPVATDGEDQAEVV